MDQQRNAQWVRASHAVGGNDTLIMTITIQGLGRLDARLVGADTAYLRDYESTEASIDEAIELTERSTLSYLWVLGAYEVVRALSQRANERPARSAATPPSASTLRSTAARGLTTKEIADTLHLTTNTVRSYAQSLLLKLQARSRIEALAAARRLHLI